ncbi:hypothetical protein EMUCRT_0324 [Ehrlichia cf. muris str. EmCRT]|uniref:Uncharacterized protein n=1 Tax=Ehrlichia cf. muris str. EmCRT TaxID=1359167 RepID=A0A0F3NEN7_9RICK|nr:hypothetical protein EMUCRT_0324 [Ehrlichia cf. muris str. EmCRT]
MKHSKCSNGYNLILDVRYVKSELFGNLNKIIDVFSIRR